MAMNNKNWVENYHYLNMLYNSCQDLEAMPRDRDELEAYFNRIDNDIPINEFKALLRRTYKYLGDDFVFKNKIREGVTEEKIVGKREFDKIWKEIETKEIQKKVKKKEEEKEEEAPLLSIIVAEKPRGGIYKLLSTEEGIIYRQIKKYRIKNTDDFYEIPFDQPILDVPFNLNELYLTQNAQRFYDVKIGNEDVCLSKSELLDFIENERNYAYVSGKDLKNYMSIILRGYEKKYKLNPTAMYPTIGIFLKKNGEFEITYPGISDIKLYGENDYQKRIIGFCEKRGIDSSGELTIPFYEIIHNNTLPLSVRLITSGYTAIEPFFYALKDYLDIFPNLFWVAPQGTGKSTFFELMGNKCYGTEMKNADDVNSEARLTKIPTSHTTPLLIDDMEKLGNIQMSFIKSISTRKKGRERMTSKQGVIIEEVYASFMGTANKDEFIQGGENMAFRVRALILRDFKKIEMGKDKKFKENIRKINQGPIFGYYLLNNALEFIKEIDDSIEDSPYEKLTSFIENIKTRLIDCFLEKFGEDYIDPRRITIYSLLLTGLYFWRYLFNKHELNVDVLSKIIAFEENDMFLQFIMELEGIEQLFSLQDFERIIDFYENPKYDFKKYYNNEEDEEIVIGTDFIHAYDKWARERGYDILEHLSIIADMESRILMEKINTGSRRVIDQNSLTPYEKPIWGVAFHLNDIRKKMKIEEENTKTDNMGSKKEITIEKLMIPEEKKIEEENAIIKRIEEIFEANKFKALEEKSIRQTLKLEFREELIERAFDFLWDKEIFIPDKNNDNLIYFKKENLLKLQ